MFLNWWRKLVRVASRRSRCQRQGLRITEFKPWAEVLEDRILLSTVFWKNAVSGDWNTGSNWSTGQTPGAGDDAVINQTGIAVTHSSGSADSVHSLTSQAAISISGGSLSLA